MRKAVAVFLALQLVLTGCNVVEAPNPTQVLEASPAAPVSPAAPLVTFAVAGDEVSVMSYVLDTTAHNLCFHLKEVDASGDTTCFSLVVRATHSENNVTLNGTVLLDQQGGLLVGLDYAWPSGETESPWFSITERTPEDVLQIVNSANNGVVTEEYTFNGKTRSFAYMEPTPNMARQIPNQPDNPPAPLRERAVREFGQWEELLSPENSLNYNQNGVFLIQILTNEEFAVWINQEFPSAGVMRMSGAAIDLPDLCMIASICSQLKCLWGGWMNFVCIACSGTSIACAIAWVGTKIASLF